MLRALLFFVVVVVPCRVAMICLVVSFLIFSFFCAPQYINIIHFHSYLLASFSLSLSNLTSLRLYLSLSPLFLSLGTCITITHHHSSSERVAPTHYPSNALQPFTENDVLLLLIVQCRTLRDRQLAEAPAHNGRCRGGSPCWPAPRTRRPSGPRRSTAHA